MEKKNYIDYIVEETKKILAIDSPSGYTKEVAEYVLGEYRALGYEPKLTVKGGVLVALGGKNKEDAVMLEAHIDTLGAIVTEIKSNGRLKVSPIGGMNANNAEAENCRVATRFSGTFEGTCQLSNASVHVNGDYSDTKRSWDEMEIVLDEKADSREETEKLGIMAGDFVCFDPRTTVTKTGYIRDIIGNVFEVCHVIGDFYLKWEWYGTAFAVVFINIPLDVDCLSFLHSITPCPCDLAVDAFTSTSRTACGMARSISF